MSDSDTKHPCWLCFGTGRIVDGGIVNGRDVVPGPDNGKPCYCVFGQSIFKDEKTEGQK